MAKLTTRKIRQRIARVLKTAGPAGIDFATLCRLTEKYFNLPAKDKKIYIALSDLEILSGKLGYRLDGTTVRYEPDQVPRQKSDFR